MAIRVPIVYLSFILISSSIQAQRMNQPESPKKPIDLDFFGESITDNYLWLENDTSTETEQWVDQQIAWTRSHLDQMPERARIADRFQELFNFEKVGAPMRVGDYFFIYKNSGLEPQGKYFVRKGLNGEDKVFLDMNALSPNGLATASLLGADDNHRWMAVAINEAGSDWSSIVIYDIATGKRLDDRLEWVKFSGATWLNDGFYYSRYPQPEAGKELSGNNLHHSVYYHAIGTPQSSDVLMHRDEERPYMYNNVSLSEDKRYLFLTSAPGTDTYEVWYHDLNQKYEKFVPLFTDMNQHTSPVDSDGDGFVLALTDYGAPRYRLVRVDLKNPSTDQWQTIVPESDMLLQGVSTCGSKLFLSYLDKANTRIFECDRDGTHRKEIALPDQTGTASGFYGRKEEDYCFYSFTSFTYPGVIFKYDLKTGKSEVFYQSKVKFNPSDYVSKQVMYPSKDGTMVPMFIVHKKGLELNGTNPTLLYSYGGFAVPMQPSFSSSRLILLEQGGVFAMPCIRGGNEFGEDWHRAGMLENKQNVFDDFIAAAEYLIRESYTSPEKLAIQGGSNGGLLVGACMTQRPELFGVAFPEVGVLDMLRFHHFTVGKGWIPEYGCADSSKKEFEYLRAYSPYHQLKPNTKYPNTMVFTADHDDRVVPAHSFKFAAQLQAYRDPSRVALIRIQKSAGHGAGMSTDQVIQATADRYAFMFHHLHVHYK